MPVRVAVVGAGPAGLCAARHGHTAGLEVTVFEQCPGVGGTWLYTDHVGTDPYGMPVHSSMYTNLITNIPKQVVMFPGFPHKESDESYITSEEVLQYLNDYADEYDLRKLCKFNHHVKNIKRTSSEWEVTVIDLPNSKENIYTFDAVCICNGLNSKPFIPNIEGADVFSGGKIHSHDYRKPKPYAGQRVLLLGGGHSALDLANHISEFADKVFLSHHSDRFKESDLTLNNNVVFKKDIKQLKRNSAEFVDDTEEEIDSFIYCTGYLCNYTFLDKSCDVTEDDGLVYPLYKNFINANHTSMCILGNMCMSMQFPTFDIQVRFFMKSLTDCSFMPDRQSMLEDIQEKKKKLAEGEPKKNYFKSTAEEDAEYYNQLAEMAGIESVPKVLTKIYDRAINQLYGNFPYFRRDKYTIIDEESYIVTSEAL